VTSISLCKQPKAAFIAKQVSLAAVDLRYREVAEESLPQDASVLLRTVYCKLYRPTATPAATHGILNHRLTCNTEPHIIAASTNERYLLSMYLHLKQDRGIGGPGSSKLLDPLTRGSAQKGYG
jgi:hypothetical protein